MLCLLKTQDEAPEPAEPPCLLLGPALQRRCPIRAEEGETEGARGGVCGVSDPGHCTGRALTRTLLRASLWSRHPWPPLHSELRCAVRSWGEAAVKA
ncbi:unnamed protein product [Rangifer tarandus platyrhynchus]|uniref:Uncharacterized protein n=2 Tax=Rangifer tarandus platyrhynchus TaxID=3082113 RepID=A0ABN8ZJ92_RANTA|nr:unnamed protein product [Rangifer tarandus platyrhynchus]CAI9708341.1 unnamed protein product [Rangifer tarandus platyrhynchus]